MQDIILELKKKLTESFQRNAACGLLFSGGLDSTILAGANSNVKAITVNLRSYGKDVGYATSAAKFLNIEHYRKSVDIDEAIEAIPVVVKMLKTFDPAIPNDLVVYFGLKKAFELGLDEIMTGDGADEIFAGYSFMKDMNHLDKYIARIAVSMTFNSNRLGNFFKIKIRQPYIDTELVDFALTVPIELKIRQENEKIWGKWVLRKAFEDSLPKGIAWQDKRPLEYGSGMWKLREIITSRISDEEFLEKSKSYSVKFINKEHLYYYQIYRKVIGEIPKPKENEKICPYCNGGIDIHSFHCKTCGRIITA